MKVPFQTHDQEREFERILDSLRILLELMKENKNNVLFLATASERLHNVVDVMDNGLNDVLTDHLLDVHEGDPFKAIIAIEPYITYQDGIDAMVSALLRSEDQNAQVERRNEQKE